MPACCRRSGIHRCVISMVEQNQMLDGSDVALRSDLAAAIQLSSEKPHVL